jgi:RNA polymerase sigma-70 factor (ECF subfamily)
MGEADSQAFEDFYAGTVRRVTAQVYAMLGDLTETEDAVAEAYARAWQRWSEVSQARDPAAWVRTVAWRLKVSAWRSLKSRAAAHVRHGESPDQEGPGPEHVALLAALRRIPEKQRRAVVLHYFAGLSIEEIAAETAAPAGTVKSWLSRGRKALAEQLGENSQPLSVRNMTLEVVTEHG